jgi:hypothetical protein
VFAGKALKLITYIYTNLGVKGESRNLHVKFVPALADMNPEPVWNQQGTTVPIPVLKPKLVENTSPFESSFVGNPIYILPAVVGSL